MCSEYMRADATKILVIEQINRGPASKVYLADRLSFTYCQALIMDAGCTLNPGDRTLKEIQLLLLGVCIELRRKNM